MLLALTDFDTHQLRASGSDEQPTERSQLARWLVARGHHAEHVSDINLADASDNTIWQYAERFRAVILTKDEDFAIWHDLRQPNVPRVVWLRIGNTRKAMLIARFEKLFAMIMERLEHGETLIEVR